MRVLLFCCLVLAGFVLAEGKSYQGHHLLSVMAENEEQVAALKSLEMEFSENDVIFLGEPQMVRKTEFVVPPNRLKHVYRVLGVVNASITVAFSNLQAEIDAEREENTRRQMKAAKGVQFIDDAHTFYRTRQSVETFMYELTANYPTLAQRKVLPHLSYEGKTIYYMEIGTNSNNPVVFVEGLAHAREWIVTAALLYSMDKMMQDYQNGFTAARNALDSYTWVIIPMVNPDGYEYTHNTDRMWRKNRKYFSSSCSGVDLNRNYDIEFGGVGASSNCRSDTYHGPSPFSETETQNVRDLFLDLESRVVSFLSIHSYSQLLLYPWGYIQSHNPSQVPSNLAELTRVGEYVRIGLESENRIYTMGTAYGVLGYAASGAAEDWALDVALDRPNMFDVYAYCYELRPRYYSDGGFVVATNEIVPSGKEVLESFYALAENMVVN